MKANLEKIRAAVDIPQTTQQRALQTGLCFLLGAILGWSAKLYDSTPIIGEIGTNLGVWITIATALAAWSRSPRAAAINVFTFFAAMLLAYYAYSLLFLGFFHKRVFMAWGSMALLSPICAWTVWYSRGTGWVAAFCAALPTSLLLLEGRGAFYTMSVSRGFDILAAGLLLLLLPSGAQQRLRILPVVAMMFLIASRLGLLSLVFGGL